VVNIALADLAVLNDDFSRACPDTDKMAVKITDVILGGQYQEVIVTTIKNDLSATQDDPSITLNDPSVTTLTVYYNGVSVHQARSARLGLKQAQSFDGKYLVLSFQTGIDIGGDSYLVLDQTGTIVYQITGSPHHVVLLNPVGVEYRLYETDPSSALECPTTNHQATYYTAYQVAFTPEYDIDVTQKSIVTSGEFCQANQPD
jgi:hypothetical protein